MSNFSSGQSCPGSSDFICSIWRKLYQTQSKLHGNCLHQFLDFCWAHLPLKAKLQFGISKLHGKIMDR